MKKRPVSKLLGAVVAAFAAMAFAACWRDEWSYSPGYIQFVQPSASLEHEKSITQGKEMVEIQRHIHLESGITPPLENPFEFLGSNCYVGSSGRHSTTLVEANPETDSFHEQNQLKPLLA